MAKEDVGLFSFNEEEWVEGGGLVDDVDVRVEVLEFAMFDYDGKVDPPGTPTIHLKGEVVEAGEDTGQQMEEYYSMGSNKDWRPTDDGTQLQAISGKAFNRGTNGGLFITSLLHIGVDPEDMGESIRCLEGAVIHVLRQDLPERKGIKKSKQQKEREEKYGPPTILVAADMVEEPGAAPKKGKTKGKGGTAGKSKTKGKSKSKAKGAAKGKGTAAKSKGKSKAKDAAEIGDEDMNVVTQELIKEVLDEEGEIRTGSLPPKLFPKCTERGLSAKQRTKVVQLSRKDEILETGEWEYDADSGTLTPFE